jgi:uncharacterized protein (DUF983 family)
VHLFLGNDDGDGASILVIVEYCMSVLIFIQILVSVKVTISVYRHVSIYEEIYVFIIPENIVYGDQIAV